MDTIKAEVERDETLEVLRTAEGKLIAAALKAAIDDLTSDNSQYKGEATAWFKSNNYDYGYYFSFVGICDFLSLDPGNIRKKYGIIKD